MPGACPGVRRGRRSTRPTGGCSRRSRRRCPAPRRRRRDAGTMRLSSVSGQNSEVRTPPAVTWAEAKPSVPRTGRMKRLQAPAAARSSRSVSSESALPASRPAYFTSIRPRRLWTLPVKSSETGRPAERPRRGGADAPAPRPRRSPAGKSASSSSAGLPRRRDRAGEVEGRGAGDPRLRKQQLALAPAQLRAAADEAQGAVGLDALERARIGRLRRYLHQRRTQGRARVAQGLQQLVAVPAAAQLLPREAAGRR